MTGNQLTPTLLSACAVLLALNIVRSEPWAFGQAVQSGPTVPTVVGGATAVAGPNTDNFRLYRFWSDGAVDETFLDYGGTNSCPVQTICGPTPIHPATCTTADLDHNAQVDISDLLGLLAFWGPCE